MTTFDDIEDRKDGKPGKNPRREIMKHSRGVVSAADRARVRDAIRALPPLSDAEVDALCEVIRITRARWAREDERADG